MVLTGRVLQSRPRIPSQLADLNHGAAGASLLIMKMGLRASGFPAGRLPRPRWSCSDLDHAVIALLVGDQALVVLFGDLADLLLGRCQQFSLLGQDHRSETATVTARPSWNILLSPAPSHEVSISAVTDAVYLDAAVDDLAQFLFVDEEIHLEQETVSRWSGST